MSVVTSVCILTDIDGPAADLESLDFVEISGHAGGPKVPQAEIWVAAYNYLSSDSRWTALDTDGEHALLLRLQQLRWPRGSVTQVFINRENDDGWKLWWQT